MTMAAALKRAYLAVYNWAVFFGWSQVLYYAVATLLLSGHTGVYAAVERPLQLAQTAAVLEILQGVVGMVRSPVWATLPQIGSRLFVTWAILWSFPFTSTHMLVSSLVISWSITEIGSRLFVTWGILWSFPVSSTHMLVSSLVISWSITKIIRYSFFGSKEVFGSAPSWLLWLRYSSFLIMYPACISSELGLINIALQSIKASQKYPLTLPNTWIYSIDCFYAFIMVLLIYVPGSVHMYTYMLGQRKKALSKSKTM